MWAVNITTYYLTYFILVGFVYMQSQTMKARLNYQFKSGFGKKNIQITALIFEGFVTNHFLKSTNSKGVNHAAIRFPML